MFGSWLELSTPPPLNIEVEIFLQGLTHEIRENISTTRIIMYVYIQYIMYVCMMQIVQFLMSVYSVLKTKKYFSGVKWVLFYTHCNL